MGFESKGSVLSFGPDDEVYGDGFYPSETTLRWSNGDGAIRVDPLQRLKAETMMEVRFFALPSYRFKA